MFRCYTKNNTQNINLIKGGILMKDINPNLCSMYCPCIDDTVNPSECNGCPNCKNDECQYEKTESPAK